MSILKNIVELYSHSAENQKLQIGFNFIYSSTVFIKLWSEYIQSELFEYKSTLTPQVS